MRILKLHLLAYGPFTNVTLDFSSPGMHVVYGRNEAGKSTALRAVAGLLYGIPKNTEDAHLHRMPELRIAGTLAREDGATLEVTRRKGTTNTLLDSAGQPMDEATLSRFVGAVGRQQFLTTFGLDHEALRAGAEALLLGHGDVGESLFGAGLAGGEVHAILRSLEAEAEALFTPLARTRPLNDAIRAYNDAMKRCRDESMSADSWLAQIRGIEEARKEKADCEEERTRLLGEKTRLERAARALPLLGKRKALLARRSELGDVPALPDDGARLREEHTKDAAEAAEEFERLGARLQDLSSRRDALVVPEALVAHEDMPLDLPNRLGSHRKAASDLPRIRGELAEAETEAQTMLSKLGKNLPLERAPSLRVDLASQARIRKLALDYARLEDKLARTARLLAEHEARLLGLRGARAELAPLPDTAEMKRIIAKSQRLRDLDERLDELRSDQAQERELARAQLSSLGISCELASATTLPIPSRETVERFAQKYAALEKDGERLAERAADLERREAEIAREIDALERSGRVPTEEDLERARSDRDENWQRVRAVLAKPRGAARAEGDLLERYESTVDRADEVADRLRREAERATRLSGLLAAAKACEKERGAALRDRQALAAETADHERIWRALWRKTGVDPLPPSDMRGWLTRHAELARTAAELSATAVEIARIEGTLAEARARLGALLPAANQSGDFADLLGRSEAWVASVDARTLERRETERTIAALEQTKETLQHEWQAGDEALSTWREAWKTSMKPLDLSAEASPEEAIAVMDQLVELFRKLDETEKTRRRAHGIERDASAFEADVARLAKEYAPDLRGPADEIAARLIDRYHGGRAARVERRELDRQIEETRSQRAKQTEKRRLALAGLAELMQAARVDTLESLISAEQRSLEANNITLELARLEERLFELGAGADPEGLALELSALDADLIPMRQEELDLALAALEERRQSIDKRIYGFELGLKKLDPAQAAAEAMAEAEQALARIREIAGRYVRVRLASLVLGREIERYRQQNQGPILARASELFRRLTLDSFGSLTADFDEHDQPILLAVRQDGRRVPVAGLSDGTRDQLYLALRLATLERSQRDGEPMPLVVDDILIHFDDDRARAALEVLFSLGDRTQILFFTHHARMLELVREAVPGGRALVHRLADPARAVAELASS